jgi:hypothetical protein
VRKLRKLHFIYPKFRRFYQVPAEWSPLFRAAVAASGLDLTEIVAVFPSDDGCPGEDDFEAQLFREVSGTRLSAVEIVPTKPVTGECFSASDPLRCIGAVRYLEIAAHTSSPDDRPAARVSSTGYDGTFAATVLSRSPA